MSAFSARPLLGIHSSQFPIGTLTTETLSLSRPPQRISADGASDGGRRTVAQLLQGTRWALSAPADRVATSQIGRGVQGDKHTGVVLNRLVIVDLGPDCLTTYQARTGVHRLPGEPGWLSPLAPVDAP